MVSVASSVVPLKYAPAANQSRTLTEPVRAVAKASGGGRTGVVIVAGKRTNSLVVQAPLESISRVLDLIAKLESRSSRSGAESSAEVGHFATLRLASSGAP